MDMVRLGIGLYGVSPIDDSCGIETVSTLKTTILQIKSLPAGETVGRPQGGNSPAIHASPPFPSAMPMVWIAI